MEYDNSNRTHIHGPDFVGAIFMCNKHTKEECFKKGLFGLPSKLSGFVKQVKSGMILFLFEHEERKLNGVFKATSDGALNIVPSAFPMSRKNFPAQVRFERLWACKPLSENEFSEAIKENYWTHKKFNFALSSQQEDRFAVNAKKDLDFFRKEKWPSAIRYDYPPGVSNDGNISDLYTDTFQESYRSQKRCSAFKRLSWAPKYFQYSSHDQVSSISESSEYLETNKPLELIDELGLSKKYSLVGAEPQVVGMKPPVEVRFDDNNLLFLNFKRRSLVKEQSIGESNVIECAVKYKRRKIVRPSFNGEDILANAGPSAGEQLSHDDHTIPFADSGHDIEGSVDVKENCINVSAKEQSFYKEPTAHVEDAGTV